MARGVAHSAPVITAAALIMIGVFGSFVLNGDPTVKQFGVGLAVAVALAGSMVLVLVPAVLVVMGRGTWWMPRWLHKGLPYVDIEGERLLAARADEEEPGVAPAPETPDEPAPETDLLGRRLTHRAGDGNRRVLPMEPSVPAHGCAAPPHPVSPGAWIQRSPDSSSSR